MCRDAGQKVQGSSDRNACSPDMRIVPDAERFSHISDLLAFGQSTRCACIWLDNVHRVRNQQFAETKPRKFTFATCDRDRKRGLDGSITRQVFGRNRLFEPSDVIFLDLTAQPDRAHRIVRVVRIDH
jgi:hypothetical protein